MSVLVSINCTTYNHEEHIGDALEGFLMQKTDFDYEILIGEDCSTDNTLKVIRSYQDKHPDRIKLIISETNKGGRRNSLNLLNISEGTYIAKCEGDDFWTDPYKLQKQVDVMRKNPNCTLCAHGATITNAQKVPTGDVVNPYNQSTFVQMQHIITHGAVMFPTCSLLYKKEALENLPNFYYNAHVGDYPLIMILASRGDVYYLNELMSVYKTGVAGSWTQRTLSGEDQTYKSIKNLEKDMWILNEFNSFTKGVYQSFVNDAKNNRKRVIMSSIKDYLERIKHL